MVRWRSRRARVALALAARRPDLVDRLVVLGTPAPDDQVPWIAPEQREVLESVRGLPADETHARLTGRLAQQIPDDPRSFAALDLLGRSAGDERALAAEGARERLGEMLATAFAHGAGGLAADVAGYCLQPWGFEPAEVAAKTLLLYGSRDPVAGPRHGRWWQQRLPQARLEVSPIDGHLLLIPRWHRVLSHLAPLTSR